MVRLTTGERVGVWIWVILSGVIWNGIYDVLLTRGVKEYLFRAALHDAGRGPAVPMDRIMEATVRDAVWVSTLWASLILLAGLVSLRLTRGTVPLRGQEP